MGVCGVVRGRSLVVKLQSVYGELCVEDCVYGGLCIWRIVYMV